MEQLIQHKKQITKFGFYGLLKNLRFFEPYLIIYFLSAQLNLFHIGLLISIREIIIYLFEIPSGVIADRYGKKTELVICFFFYLASFLMFFISTEFYMFALSMILYALGEAFRSGTHKSMIMAYIDKHDIKVSKTKIYGLTRSYSLIGSMIASLVSIGLILWLPEIKYLFLFAMIPYTLDLLLILSYPSYLNDRKDVKFSYKSFLIHGFESVKYTLVKGKVRSAIFNSASYQATFKSIKDYIQPILITVSLSFVLFSTLSEDENTKVYIGLIYAFIYLISAISSKHAYRVKKFGQTKQIISFMWFFTGVSMIVLSLFLNSIWVVFLVFLFLYIMMNIRRPLMVEIIGDVSDPDKRATVLSVESQITSLLIVIGAPLIGLLAEYSMRILFMSFGILMFAIFIFSIFSVHKDVK